MNHKALREYKIASKGRFMELAYIARQYKEMVDALASGTLSKEKETHARRKTDLIEICCEKAWQGRSAAVLEAVTTDKQIKALVKEGVVGENEGPLLTIAKARFFWLLDKMYQ